MSAIVLLGFIGTFCLIWAYRKGEAAIVAPMQYCQILWATVFGSLLPVESLTMTTLVGFGMVILNGAYIVAREAFCEASENRPVSCTRTRSFGPGGIRVSTLLRRR